MAEFYNAVWDQSVVPKIFSDDTQMRRRRSVEVLAAIGIKFSQHLWLKKTNPDSGCGEDLFEKQWLKSDSGCSFPDVLPYATKVVFWNIGSLVEHCPSRGPFAIFHDWCTKYHVSRKPQSKLLAFWGQGGCAANTYKVGRVSLTAWKPYKCNWLPCSLLGCFLNIWAIENRPSLLRQYWTIENKWRAEPMHRPADFFKFADKVFLDGWFWPWDVCPEFKADPGSSRIDSYLRYVYAFAFGETLCAYHQAQGYLLVCFHKKIQLASISCPVHVEQTILVYVSPIPTPIISVLCISQPWRGERPEISRSISRTVGKVRYCSDHSVCCT